jgi:hypothetical protein
MKVKRQTTEDKILVKICNTLLNDKNKEVRSLNNIFTENQDTKLIGKNNIGQDQKQVGY